MLKNQDGDSVTENAVEAQVSNPVLNESSLAKMFMKATEADTQEVEEVNDEAEPQAFEDPEEGEHSEVSEVEAEEEQSLEEETEGAEEEESNEGDVLSKQDKSLKKMRKRIDKATKNWRSAEEETESLKEEIESLKTQISSNNESKSSTGQSFKDIAGNAENIGDLQAVYEKAEKAEEWIEDALDQLRDSGEDELIVNETTYTRQEIKSFQKEVRNALKKDIPNRAKVFEQRTQYDEYALKEFDFLGDPESSGYKYVEQIMGDKDLGGFLSGRADQMQILGLLAEGLISQNARQSKQSSSAVDKTKDAVSKPVSTPKIAPAIPFVRSNVANARKAPSEKSNQVKRDIMSRPQIGQRELTKLFM